jgi:indolepyruvate ferredoxin oxidoreductase beta subunit
MQPLLDRVRKLASAVQPIVFEGVLRCIDYQDPAYASLYLDRLERIAGIDARFQQKITSGALGAGGAVSSSDVATSAQSGGWALTTAIARGLALWMTFEDTMRVADLKTRSARFARVRSEIRADADQLFGITEFMKPRVEEIAGTLPVGVGRWVLRSPGVSRRLKRWTGGKQIRTSTVTGFLFLHALAGMKRWRRATLRYHEENGRIESWLSRIEALAPNNYALAVELARAQRLIKGYGETHERAWRNFTLLVEQLDALSARPDGAALMARLQEAALADEEGNTLAKELSGRGGTAPSASARTALS